MIAFALTSFLAFSAPTDLAKMDRARGALLGVAYGDAFGRPLLRYSRKDIADVYGRYRRIPKTLPFDRVWSVRGGESLLMQPPPGAYGQATQRALALLAQILARNTWNADVAREWGRVLAVNGVDWRGASPTVRRASKRLRDGVAYQHAGLADPTVGPGLSAAAVAALVTTPPERRRAAVLESSLVTHADVRAAALAFAVYQAASWLVDGRAVAEVRRDLGAAVTGAEFELLNMTSHWTIGTEEPHLISNLIKDLFSRQPPIRARDVGAAVVHSAFNFLPPGTFAEPASAFAGLGGVTALALALDESVGVPHDVLELLANYGEATEAVTAIAGGVLGARFGVGWIPNRDFADALRLEKYAAFATAGHRPEGPGELMLAESSLTAYETEFARGLARRCAAALGK